jgi:hypothetical protein
MSKLFKAASALRTPSVGGADASSGVPANTANPSDADNGRSPFLRSISRSISTAVGGGRFQPAVTTTPTSMTGSAFSSAMGDFPNSNGKRVLFVRDVSSVCGGMMSGGIKFCCREPDICPYGQHKDEKFEGLAPGYYIKANKSSVFLSPTLPMDAVTEETSAAMLDADFEISEARQAFSLILNSQEETKKISFQDLAERFRITSETVKLQTPVKRRKVTVMEEYQGLMNMWDSEMRDTTKSSETTGDVLADKILAFNQFVTRVLTEDQTSLQILSDKVDLLQSVVGNEMEGGDNPPTLFLTLAMLKQNILQLEKEKAESSWVTSKDLTSAMESNLMESRRDCTNLHDKTRQAFETIEGRIEAIHVLSSQPPTNGVVNENNQPFLNNLIPGGSSNSEDENKVNDERVDGVISHLVERVKNLTDLCESLGKEGRNRTTVSIGEYTFHNIRDLSAWAEKFLPPNFSFGSFVDIYSFMERVISSKDVASSTALKNMETRNKLSITADEAIIIESFKHPLPKVFSGSSSSDTLSLSSWLPGIPTKEKWEDTVGLSGAKILLQENEAIVRNRVEEVINLRLRGYPEAQSLARVLLSDTITFMNALSRFISETYKRLKESGFGKVDSWKLVSKVVHRIFATDCHLQRGTVSEFLDASDNKTMAVGVLWGTFATHQVMREYMINGVENHPSISSEYVRFLVANCGLERIVQLEAKATALTTELQEVKKMAQEAKKAAISASNKADQVEKASKKK